MSNTQIARPSSSVATEPSPFIKWAGGKARLLDQYARHFPTEYGTYHEPFLGGGAVFFHHRPERAKLSDINPKLVATYIAVRDHVEDVMERLELLRQCHNAETYYAARERFNKWTGLAPAEQAALFIYLNKTCFNGLYRENSKGRFNVPLGSYENPTLFDRAHLLAAHRALQGVEIECASFERVLRDAQPGDLVYFDPPYVPLSATSSFTTYFADGFSDGLQVSLAQTFDALAKRGCYVLLSNSSAPMVRDLYAGYEMHEIAASRSINSRKEGRGKVTELLVTQNLAGSRSRVDAA